MKVLICGESYSTNLGDGVIADALSKMLLGDQNVTHVRLYDLSGRGGYPENSTAKPVGLIRRIHRSLYRRGYFYGLVVNWVSNRVLVRLGNRSSSLEDKLHDCDLVVIGGGQLLRDNRLSFPTIIEFVVAAARRMDRAVIFFGVGVGEHWSLLGRYYFRKSLSAPNVRSIYCRDKQSRKRLEDELGEVRASVRTTFDAALGILNPPPKRSQGGKSVGLCVMDAAPVLWTQKTHALAGEADTVAYWHELACSILDTGMRVRIFTNGSPEDQEVAEEVNRILTEDRTDGDSLELMDRPKHPEDLVNAVQRMVCVVGFRLHACAIAYTYGVPCVALSWDDKVRQFMAYTRRDRFFIEDILDFRRITKTMLEAIEQPVDPILRESIAREVSGALTEAVQDATAC